MVNLRLGGIAVAERAGLSGLNAVPSSMTYHGGRLLTHVRVKPIFWGPQWLTLGHPAVPPAAIVWTIRTILFSPYMSALSQYGGIQSGTVEPLGLATFDAGPPNGFTSVVIEQMLKGLLDDRIAERVVDFALCSVLVVKELREQPD